MGDICGDDFFVNVRYELKEQEGVGSIKAGGCHPTPPKLMGL